MVYLWIVLGVLALDQLSKWLILDRLELYETLPLLDGWLNLTQWHNSGGAFGILQGQGIWLAWIAVFVSIGIVVLLVRYPRVNHLINVGLALIAGGALGNLIDRIRLGFVVDFIQGCINHVCVFPVFNVADSAIVIGTGLILWAWLRQPKQEGDEEQALPADETGQERSAQDAVSQEVTPEKADSISGGTASISGGTASAFQENALERDAVEK